MMKKTHLTRGKQDWQQEVLKKNKNHIDKKTFWNESLKFTSCKSFICFELNILCLLSIESTQERIILFLGSVCYNKIE